MENNQEIYNNQINEVEKIAIDNYHRDVTDLYSSRRVFLCLSDWLNAIGNSIAIVATVLAFSAGFFNNTYLSFASGCSGAISVGLLRYSDYSKDMFKQKSQRIVALVNTNTKDDDSNDGHIPINQINSQISMTGASGFNNVIRPSIKQTQRTLQKSDDVEQKINSLQHVAVNNEIALVATPLYETGKN